MKLLFSFIENNWLQSFGSIGSWSERIQSTRIFHSEREKDLTADKPKLPQQLIHHQGLFKSTGGHVLKLHLSQAKCTSFKEKHYNACYSLLSESCTPTPGNSTTMSFSELGEWEKTLFSEYWSQGDGTKCKRFGQIDLLSRSSAGVWTSLSWISVGCTGSLRSLICVIVKGELKMNHQSSIQGTFSR